MVNLTQHERTRPRLWLRFSREQWDRSKGLKQAITVVFVLSTLGAAGNWYNWAHGTISLSFPVVLTVVAAVSLALSPRKWQLLVMSASGLLGLAILGTVLGRAPLRIGIEVIVATAAIAGICEYVRQKVEGPEWKGGVRQSDERRD